jgi:uncharacterized protein (DUF924 family)
MHQEILKFWFEELEQKQWWIKDLELDQFESLQLHEEAVELFRRNCQQGNFEYELKHKAIVERFGRQPTESKLNS